MSSEVAISAVDISKCYHVYHKPNDRLKQLLMPRLRRALGLPPRNYFSEFWALGGVSFEIQRGETVGIVGRNGSGKSTLLQIICGTLNPTHGTLATHGRIAALLELGSGFNPEFTGRENVFMNAALLGMSRAEVEARYEDIVTFADIGEFVDQPVKTYSSGMVVRLAFAVAINADPEILVVDEALSVGDELFQRKCFSRIEAIKKAGATILFVSHSGGTVVELCDRAILMDSGHKLAVGTPKSIVTQYQKLLYASAETREKVRADILNGTLDAVPAPKANGRLEQDSGATLAEDGGLADVAMLVDQTQSEAFLDPGLVPTSTVVYESRGAVISNPCIRTKAGKKVNNLVRGETYLYCYDVTFTRPTEGVRYGMLIKTISGVELGGASAASPSEHGRRFLAGDSVSISIKFRCSLNPGTFFLNAGVTGQINGSDTYLHRVIDAAMFRVQTVAGAVTTGTVDFDPQYSFIDEQIQDE